MLGDRAAYPGLVPNALIEINRRKGGRRGQAQDSFARHRVDGGHRGIRAHRHEIF